jgi:uncharacterized membrane protein YkoI
MDTEEKATAKIAEVLKKDKKILEEALSVVLEAFKEKTGLEVTEIKLSKMYLNGFEYGDFHYEVNVKLGLWGQ